MLGPDHVNTLNLRGDIAHMRGMTGNPDSAATAFEAVQADFLRLLGPNHLGTLQAKQVTPARQSPSSNTYYLNKYGS